MTATPSAPRDPLPHLLDAALKRRAELRSTSTLLVRALEAASPGREAAWVQRARGALDALREDIAEHIERTESPDGLYDEVRSAQPRLANQVARLVADHESLRERVTECTSLAERAAAEPSAENVQAVREETTTLINLLQLHRQRGSDLIYEAYETDIGGDE